jgi:hypothetical protein
MGAVRLGRRHGVLVSWLAMILFTLPVIISQSSDHETSWPIEQVSLGPPTWPERSVSFWYDCSGCSGTQPDWPSLLRKVKAHKAAITSIILFCGVEIAPGGLVAGLERWNSSACATQLVPSLLRLGVRVEMGVQSGTSDVRDYRRLFAADPQHLAEQLAALGRQHGLSGWNMDLEPQKGNPASVASDALRYSTWAQKVRPNLHDVGLRFTTAVAGWGAMIADYEVISRGFDRLMDMSTYNAVSLSAWLPVFEHFTVSTPHAATAVGLGCWIDAQTNGTGAEHWSATEASATQRICYAMNMSVPEVSFWVLGPDQNTGQKPESFWWAPLLRYLSGGVCEPPSLPPAEVCPTTLPHSHRAAPGGCCVASYIPGCAESCEEALCNATSGWYWKRGLNYSRDLYTCCPDKTVV